MEVVSPPASHSSLADLAKGHLRSGAGLSFKPYWWEAAPPQTSGAALPRDVDVAVIGSGYTGLSAALELARRGRAVVVLERDVAGYGASTRNGGQIGTGNQKVSAEVLASAHRKGKALDLLREGQRVFDHIVRFISDENIDCRFRRCGRFRGAMRPAHYDKLARTMSDLQKATGLESFMVPRADIHTEVGTDIFFGGTVIVNDASLHPALYHAGLLQRAQAAGAAVVCNAEVTTIAREGSGFRLRTAAGDLKCGDVIVATDGYSGPLVPRLRTRIVPIASAQIATGEIATSEFERLIPNDRVYGNTNRVFSYFRSATGERRLLFGGRATRFGASDAAASYAHLARDLLTVFPSLKDVTVTHAWSGLIGQTQDAMPHIGRTADGVHYALGYCGNAGVARGTYYGRKVALKVLGDPDGRTALDDLSFPAFPAHAVAVRAVPLVEAWMSLRDRLNI